MRKRILLFIALLFSCSGLQAQYISLDTIGRVNKIKLNTGNSTPFDIEVKGTISEQFLKEKLKSFFIKKLDTTIKNLSDPNLLYLSYYPNQKEIKSLTDELKAIKAWIKDSATVPSITHLNRFFEHLNKLLNSTTADWYQLNGLPFSNTIQLADNKFDAVANAYIIDLTVNQLFNKFSVNLYNDTYQKKDNTINSLTTTTYLESEKALTELYNKALTFPKNVNDLTKDDYDSINIVDSSVKTNPIIYAIMNAEYFKNWIWLRGGEPVINPFEILAKDTVKGKSTTPLTRKDNVSLIAQTSVPSKLLNSILFSKGGIKKERNIHFFRLQDDPTKTQTSEIDDPLRGDENVRINMHNTPAVENPTLSIIKQEAHSGRNSLVDNISSGIGILATAYASFNPSLAFLTTIFGQTSTNKNVGDLLYQIRTIDNTITDKVIIQKQIEAILKKENSFNKSVFEETKAVVPLQMANGLTFSTPAYLDSFARKYGSLYNEYASSLKRLYRDSLVLSATLPIIAQSNLPPDTMIMNSTGTTTSAYRTVILETGKVDKDVTTEYAVRNFFTKDEVKDSTTLATFTVKTANLKRMMASAGLMFTAARANYAQTTYTEGTATTGAKIETSAKTTSFVVGLNIYFARINMLDEHWFHSKECPYYTRFSLFLGLDIPDVMDHFYPGISFDLNPGIKLTGGAHLYRHKKYSIANNQIKKEANILAFAGPFIGLNIDTDAIIKVINIFKKN